MTVKESGNYGSLPEAKREKYKFTGWYTDPSGGDKVSGGQAFTANADQTLYAHWENDPEAIYTSWENSFKLKANDIKSEDKKLCYIADPDKSEKELLEDCRGDLADNEDEAEYIIQFVKKFDEKNDEELAEIIQKYFEDHPESSATVVLLSDEALKGSKNQKLIYRMALLDAIYGSFGTEDIDKAASELDVEYSYPYY